MFFGSTEDVRHRSLALMHLAALAMVLTFTSAATSFGDARSDEGFFLAGWAYPFIDR
jgi:hypothetical protein